jgi:hypothetical protein
MRTRKILLAVAPWLVATGLVAANCTGEMGLVAYDGLGGLNTPDPVIGCDPDDPDSCPDTWFQCTVDDAGNKRCEGVAVPDDGGGWDCEPRGAALVCEGDHVPDGEGWACAPAADGTVECSRDFAPGGGGDGTWTCEDQGEFTVCAFGDGSWEGGGDADADGDGDGDADGGGGGDCPPGVELPTEEICDDDLDNDCDGETDEGCDEVPCLCVPGARRYCDETTFCYWGEQFCAADGLSWSACVEIDPPWQCAGIDGWYSAEAEACCVAMGGCCQDYHDLDGDVDRLESVGDCIDIVCEP